MIRRRHRQTVILSTARAAARARQVPGRGASSMSACKRANASGRRSLGEDRVPARVARGAAIAGSGDGVVASPGTERVRPHRGHRRRARPASVRPHGRSSAAPQRWQESCTEPCCRLSEARAPEALAALAVPPPPAHCTAVPAAGVPAAMSIPGALGAQSPQAGPVGATSAMPLPRSALPGPVACLGLGRLSTRCGAATRAAASSRSSADRSRRRCPRVKAPSCTDNRRKDAFSTASSASRRSLGNDTNLPAVPCQIVKLQHVDADITTAESQSCR